MCPCALLLQDSSLKRTPKLLYPLKALQNLLHPPPVSAAASESLRFLLFPKHTNPEHVVGTLF